MINEEHLSKFQQLYRERFGRTISRDEALAKGIELIELIKLIYKPITREEYRQFCNASDIKKSLTKMLGKTPNTMYNLDETKFD